MLHLASCHRGSRAYSAGSQFIKGILICIRGSSNIKGFLLTYICCHIPIKDNCSPKKFRLKGSPALHKVKTKNKIEFVCR